MKNKFPDDFNWGVATTAIQIEGGLDLDGRGPSMWPAFARQPGNIKHGDTPAGSAASYENLERDLDAVARLNLTSYNFSASWPRILPDGSGQPNEKALEYYDRLVDGLLERNVKPDFSLYDWDLPQRFLDGKKGWAERDMVNRFADYADILLKRYGDRVTNWMTFNEVTTQATNGYFSGNHAPGFQDAQLAVRAYHHLMMAHGTAVQRIRTAVPDAEISFVDNMLQYYPKTVSQKDRDACDRSWTINAWYLLHALFKKEYFQPFLDYFIKEHGCNFDHLQDGDLDIIATPFDKFGVNYFTSFSVEDNPNPKSGAKQKVSAAPGPKSDYGWTIDPLGMTDALRKLKKNFTHDLPLFIGECGIGNYDYPDPTGRVRDTNRVDYLHKHLEQVLVAREEGIPVNGFYVWSLMDNYEWDNGYSKRMGLFFTQYHQPEQYLIKDSGRWYSQLCKTGELKEKLAEEEVK